VAAIHQWLICSGSRYTTREAEGQLLGAKQPPRVDSSRATSFCVEFPGVVLVAKADWRALPGDAAVDY